MTSQYKHPAVTVQLKRVAEPRGRDARAPAYMSVGAAGADLCAALDAPLTLAPLGRGAVATGWEIAIPDGYEGQVRPRSGLAFKSGVTVANAPGTIDSDYRGELKVLLVNLSNEPFTINSGDRIAQLIIAPVVQAEFSEETELVVTVRGARGFGSTGK